jgi:RimJ/RimL family protein N-acetyltransferase
MCPQPIPTLQTQRLTLRPLRPDDFDDYAALHADPEVMRFFDHGTLWDRARAWRHMASLVGSWYLTGCGMWVVEERAGAAFCGLVGLAEAEGWPGCELAGRLAPRFWGRGYATEANHAALACAFLTLGKDRVISLVHPDNRAAQRLVERTGETFLHRIQLGGHELLCYGLDAATYRARIAIAAASPAAGQHPCNAPAPLVC